MAISVETLALAKKYTDKTVEGTGALKGAPCTVKSIVDIPGGTRITLEWEDNSGTKETQSFDVMNGTQGVSISSVEINNSGHVIVHYSDGTQEDAGAIVVDYNLLNNLPEINGVELKGDKSIEDLGLVTNDTVYMDANGSIAIGEISEVAIAALFSEKEV